MSGVWLLAVLVLQLVTAAPLPWESAARPAAWLQLSPDLAFLLCVACILVRATGTPRLSAAALGLLTACIPLYRFGETLMPTFYGKPFEPWIDLLEVPGLVHLLTHRHSTPVQMAMLGGTVLAFALGLWLLTRVWRCVLTACATPRIAFSCLVGTQAIFAASFLVTEATRSEQSLLRPSMLRAAFDDLASTLSTPRWHGDAVVRERVQAAADELLRAPQNLAGLAGADVYFLIIESYGRGVLGHRARPRYEAWLQADAAVLAAAGWHAASGWIAPSVRGGGSSLAHAEMLSGIDVEDRRVFDSLLASTVRTLAAIARDAGYHTVDVQPAMPRAWPEAKALGFVEDVFQSAFTYHGRAYHWGVMPDQFALQHVLATQVGKREQPLFLQYVGVTSHAPFSMVPPYYDDWSRVAAPDAFAGEPAEQWDIGWTTYADHPQVEDAYLATIRYCLRTAFGFARQLQRKSLLVVVGDHQPPMPYPDRPGRIYDVPLHLLSNDASLLTPMLGLGLHAGLVPDSTQASFKASRLLFRFLRAYGKEAR